MTECCCHNVDDISKIERVQSTKAVDWTFSILGNEKFLSASESGVEIKEMEKFYAYICGCRCSRL